jgi:regulator of sigma E protease
MRHPLHLILVGIMGLALLMIVHECGHFFIARAFGMRVTKFSIGFGPTFFKIVPRDGYFWFTTAAERIRLRMWKHDPERHGPTVYQVAMIPFLAYVQIAGMNPLEEIDQNDKGSYANASLMGRILTIFGGPAANYLFASVLFFAGFFAGGRDVAPRDDERGSTEVTVVADPAEAAGIKSGDRIVEVNQKPVERWTEMAEAISRHPEETIPIVVERSGQRLTFSVTPRRVDTGHGKKKGRSIGRIGVQLATHHEKVSVREAAILALEQPPKVVKSVVINIGEFVSGDVEGELSGPVGMVGEVAKVAGTGVVPLLILLGSISAYLGAFNLIPFPALDGARLMFLGYEATTRRRANARIETHIHLIGLFMMLGLMFYVTVNDLRRPDSSDSAPGATPSATSAPAPATPELQPVPAVPAPTTSGK